MGMWNTHGMSKDDDCIWDAIEVLGLSYDEMTSLVEHCRKEVWVWSEVARRQRGQDKRKSNLISKYFQLRMDKWINLVVEAEMEYEHEHGEFSSNP
jgi:hypothetical protein